MSLAYRETLNDGGLAMIFQVEIHSSFNITSKYIIAHCVVAMLVYCKTNVVSSARITKIEATKEKMIWFGRLRFYTGLVSKPLHLFTGR